LFEEIFQKEYARTLAFLYGYFRDYELAEDALQEAFLKAIEHWPSRGLPEKPGAWLTVVAKNKGLDVIRKRQRQKSREENQIQDQLNYEEDFSIALTREIPDERLEFFFTCCHPALSPESQVALTLRSFGRLSTAEIAQAFLTSEKTMAQRLVRAKKKLSSAGIPFRIPSGPELYPRLNQVLNTIYLIFNEGYFSRSTEHPLRQHLVLDSLHLVRALQELLENHPLPLPQAETKGLLALILFAMARQPARGSVSQHILLEDQDRSLWDQGLIQEGEKALDEAMAESSPGPYQLQGAISALHCQSPRFEDTDWKQIILLYQGLLKFNSSPSVHLAYIVALANGGQLKTAKEQLDRSPPIPSPLSLTFGLTKAFILQKELRYGEAKKVFESLLEGNLTSSEVLTIKSRIESLPQ
jgi:RNA polymerase sigma-70 factor (ECF subfamily)